MSESDDDEMERILQEADSEDDSSTVPKKPRSEKIEPSAREPASEPASETREASNVIQAQGNGDASDGLTVSDARERAAPGFYHHRSNCPLRVVLYNS